MELDKKKFTEQNWGIAVILLLLSLISFAMIYSASQSFYYVVMQLVWYIIGCVAILIIMQFDEEKLWKLSPYLYGLGILLLIAVLLFGVVIGGAKRWLDFGIMNFQTSEVMKIALILFLARVVTTHNQAYLQRTLRTDWLLLGKIILFSIPPLVLVMLQPDLGTTIVFMAIIAGITLISGISWKILLPIVVTLIIFIGGIFFLIQHQRELLYKVGFHAYQFDRVDVWLNPNQDVSGNSYQLLQSIKAIGSGKIFGKGFGVSEVHVPENHTDFIFTVVGENFGFLGACVLLLLYFLLIYRFIQTCFYTKKNFHSYIVAGMTMLVSFHVFENIGMTVGLLPVTGVPLPFISYGGSSLLGNMIAVGLVLSMNYQHRVFLFEKEGEDFN